MLGPFQGSTECVEAITRVVNSFFVVGPTFLKFRLEDIFYLIFDNNEMAGFISDSHAIFMIFT